MVRKACFRAIMLGLLVDKFYFGWFLGCKRSSAGLHTIGKSWAMLSDRNYILEWNKKETEFATIILNTVQLERSALF